MKVTFFTFSADLENVVVSTRIGDLYTFPRAELGYTMHNTSIEVYRVVDGQSMSSGDFYFKREEYEGVEAFFAAAKKLPKL